MNEIGGLENRLDAMEVGVNSTKENLDNTQIVEVEECELETPRTEDTVESDKKDNEVVESDVKESPENTTEVKRPPEETKEIIEVKTPDMPGLRKKRKQEEVEKKVTAVPLSLGRRKQSVSASSTAKPKTPPKKEKVKPTPKKTPGRKKRTQTKDKTETKTKGGKKTAKTTTKAGKGTAKTTAKDGKKTKEKKEKERPVKKRQDEKEKHDEESKEDPDKVLRKKLHSVPCRFLLIFNWHHFANMTSKVYSGEWHRTKVAGGNSEMCKDAGRQARKKLLSSIIILLNDSNFKKYQCVKHGKTLTAIQVYLGQWLGQVWVLYAVPIIDCDCDAVSPLDEWNGGGFNFFDSPRHHTRDQSRHHTSDQSYVNLFSQFNGWN